MLSPYVPSVNFLVGAHLMRLFPSQKLQPGILHCIAFYCRWSFINYPSTCGFWRWPACRENMRQSWICKVHSPRELNELKVVIWRTSIVVLWMIDPPKIFDMIEQFIISCTDRVILPRCSYDNSIPAGILSVNHTNPGIGSSEIVCPRKITTSITRSHLCTSSPCSTVGCAEYPSLIEKSATTKYVSVVLVWGLREANLPSNLSFFSILASNNFTI